MTILDVVCFDDLDEFGAEITEPIEALKQDNYHRLVELPGSNIDDPGRGLGLVRLLNGKESDLVSAGPRVEAELRKDPRNAEVRCRITPVAKGEYDIDIAIVPDPEQLGSVEGEFLMQLRARGETLEFR